MLVCPSTTSMTIPNPFDDITFQDELCLDDEITQKLQTQSLPLEVQLMLIPMWTLRSAYHECMRPLDKAMEDYMDFRKSLVSIDKSMEFGTATNDEVASAFERIFNLFQAYEKNQRDLLLILKRVAHQLSFYTRAAKGDLMWNEMARLREIDEVSASRRTCCFEHVVMSLLKLDESVKDSIQSSQDVAKCCANYLSRISSLFNFPKEDHKAEVEPPKSVEVEDVEQVGSS